MEIVKTVDAAFGAIREVCDDGSEAPIFSTGTGFTRVALGGLELVAGLPLAVSSKQRKRAFAWIHQGIRDILRGPLEMVPVVSNEVWQRINGVRAQTKKLEQENLQLRKANTEVEALKADKERLQRELESAKEEHGQKYEKVMRELTSLKAMRDDVAKIANKPRD